MRGIAEIGRELDAMVENGRSVAEIAVFLTAEAWQTPSLLHALGNFCNQWEALLTLENLRQWPEEHAETLATFFLHLPCSPQPETWPCGKKELLLAAALQDQAVPKSIRARLWRCLVMDGYILPCYERGMDWKVPPVLYDHHAVRRWICLTKQEGWEDLRCSDPFFFGNDVLNQFDSDDEKKALEAIETDCPPALMMPFDVRGKNLHPKYMQAALAKKAVEVVTYLYYNDRRFTAKYSPRTLLLYVCANWNHDETIPFVSCLEKANPGLVKDTLDTFGHDALYYTLYQRDRFNRAPDAARRAMSPLARKLIDLGCDPDRQNALGLSYRDLTA